MNRILSAIGCAALFTFTSAHAATPPLRDRGPAPELAGVDTWINSAPLTLKGLRGKVVLVDFWTYSCINCVRTLPHVARWHETYKDRGLVVIGVHTPEYPFERSTNNVRTATRRFGLTYPVAQDNGYATWKAFSNQYWPAAYLIDQQGRIVHTQIGEGGYAEMDAAIRTLLQRGS
ncbi:thioredoxin family protein [Pseudoduganella buxea]|uniref:Redoxin domain-containing protein n=1 Tax=Pseudoduganella buxea TaxID=1949069 RepID=A0A6I3T3L4_9BURK|nr:thioredoxin family protein [Pseudoduganella buxea]MTV55316.1 redoxin domain-containing protein [Pseudoduganella buxea]GGC16182.1 thioredoxin [Pseudoduganella buxea]